MTLYYILRNSKVNVLIDELVNATHIEWDDNLDNICYTKYSYPSIKYYAIWTGEGYSIFNEYGRLDKFIPL